ncbi:MAG: hypothetical protein WBQ73_02470 [Candidatus Babeliales bacterium]
MIFLFFLCSTLIVYPLYGASYGWFSEPKRDVVALLKAEVDLLSNRRFWDPKDDPMIAAVVVGAAKIITGFYQNLHWIERVRFYGDNQLQEEEKNVRLGEFKKDEFKEIVEYNNILLNSHEYDSREVMGALTMSTGWFLYEAAFVVRCTAWKNLALLSQLGRLFEDLEALSDFHHQDDESTYQPDPYTDPYRNRSFMIAIDSVKKKQSLHPGYIRHLKEQIIHSLLCRSQEQSSVSRCSLPVLDNRLYGKIKEVQKNFYDSQDSLEEMVFELKQKVNALVVEINSVINGYPQSQWDIMLSELNSIPGYADVLEKNLDKAHELRTLLLKRQQQLKISEELNEQRWELAVQYDACDVSKRNNANKKVLSLHEKVLKGYKEELLKQHKKKQENGINTWVLDVKEKRRISTINLIA